MPQSARAAAASTGREKCRGEELARETGVSFEVPKKLRTRSDSTTGVENALRIAADYGNRPSNLLLLPSRQASLPSKMRQAKGGF
jgi:hypothetical protein